MTPEIIIAQARSWVGTPFHHQGRVKAVGCDCLGLLIGIAEELKLTHNGVLLAGLDNIHYSTTPNTEELLEKMAAHLFEIEGGADRISIGDIALMCFDDNPQHLGIITDYIHGGLGILHAIRNNGVCEHRLNGAWRKRIYKAYRFIE